MEPDRRLPADEEALVDLLTRHLLRAADRDRPRRLGLEFECLRVERDGRAAPALGPEGPEPRLEDLVPVLGDPTDAQPIVEDGVLSMVRIGKGSLSVEPGGQIEVSLPPLASPASVAPLLKRCVDVLEEGVAREGRSVLYLGHQPLSLPDEIPLRAKPRYRIMDRRLRRVERLGPHMMRATAGMQVTLDVRDEREAFEMLLAASVAAPLITALFANSPLVGGRPAGFRSYREEAWLHTDPCRCGVPAPLFEPGASFRNYVRYALAAECWFLPRGGDLVETPAGVSFYDLWRGGEARTLADFDLHASTLFPVARIRGGVEVRSADCVPPEVAPAFCALAAGLLYDEESRTAAAELHGLRSPDAITALHEAAARDGLAAVGPGGYRVVEGCRRLLALAEAGLRRLARCDRVAEGGVRLLEPLRRRLDEGRSFADETLAVFERDGIEGLLRRDRRASCETFLGGLGCH